jgi:hypothetical protein
MAQQCHGRAIDRLTGRDKPVTGGISPRPRTLNAQMRNVTIVGVGTALATATASAAPQTLELHAMAPAAPTLAAACEAARAEACKEDAGIPSGDTMTCRCRQIDRAGSSAVLAIDAAYEYHATHFVQRWRFYGLVLRDSDGWHLERSSPYDPTGSSYDSGNCCESVAVGPMRYAAWTTQAAGFDGPVAVLEIEHPYRTIAKPNWPDDGGRSPVRVYGDLLICGQSERLVMACVAARVRCTDERVSIGSRIVTACPGAREAFTIE